MQSIRLKNISKSFGTTRALNDISLEIAHGKRLVLIGGSGAGKTTLLRVLAGLEQADGGTVSIGDVDITSTPAHQRGIAFLSQDYAVYPQLSVLKNLQAALDPLQLSKAERAERLEIAMTWFELGALADRRPAQLSGGQLQRAALAKALVRRPQVLILDEPFSQLDPMLREQSRQLILATTDEFAMSLIMVTHDAMDALRLADQLAVLERGKLIHYGSPEDVYRRPNSRQVAELLSPFGINELELNRQSKLTKLTSGDGSGSATQRILFRPESAVICDDQELQRANPEFDDVCFEGLVTQSQLLGFSRLLYVEVASPHPDSAPQIIKILSTIDAKYLPHTIRICVARCDLLNIPSENTFFR